MQGTSLLRSTRVGLLSTEPIRLAGLTSVFEDYPTIDIVVGDLKLLLADTTIHYVVLDISHNYGWIETLYQVRKMRPDIRQIILGPPGDEEMILRSIVAGARAYLDINSGPLMIRQAVDVVIQGSIWAPRRLLSKLIDRLLTHPIPAVTPTSLSLSPREQQVLTLIMTACSNREIAHELGIEERTVKAYVSSLMRKTGAENRVSLSVQATQSSFLGARNGS
jgi:DNA-binding NarL/FixJ family response regulator